MKNLTIVLALAALTSFNAFASPDPCEGPALAAAKKWARSQGLRGSLLQVAGISQDAQGNSIYGIQLADSRSNADCWTNINVTVQEAADDSCKALKVEEDTSAESCS